MVGPDLRLTRALPLMLENLRRGRYTVVVLRPGYVAWKKEVEVRSGQVTTEIVELIKSGRLSILGTPKGAKVLIIGSRGSRIERRLPVTDARSDSHESQ